ncbi:MAG: beta-ketoacyl-[acyl-carrier-protein] synthase II [Calditrichaeota bacterium]|nr:MAG: beta-ketoacyl-[acyl-carrier-protein] synthase II [Calditrichota bacterium]
MQKHNECVVITGMGLVTPLGKGLDENWDNLKNGHSGVRTISLFDASDLSTQIAGEVVDFNPLDYVDKKKARQYDRFIHLSIAAGDMAMQDAGLDAETLPSDRTGILVGSGMGGMETFVENALTLEKRGHRRVSPFFVPSIITNMAPGLLSIRYGTRGVNFAISSACATGAHALGEACRMIQRGEADVMIAGGSEAALIPLGVAGFIALKALSARNNEPEKASRPFDKGRDGFVMGEGSGILILENERHARARNAQIYARFSGIGYSSDAYHPTAPSSCGSGASLAMKNAIYDAGIDPGDIDYINAHGTSTHAGDRAEVAAAKSVFNGNAADVSISSTKSMTGHMLGAAGSIEAIFSILALKHGELPPTINLDDLDPECELNHVANKSRKHAAKFALSNSFGFGGTNSSLIFEKM